MPQVVSVLGRLDTKIPTERRSASPPKSRRGTRDDVSAGGSPANGARRSRRATVDSPGGSPGVGARGRRGPGGRVPEPGALMGALGLRRGQDGEVLGGLWEEEGGWADDGGRGTSVGWSGPARWVRGGRCVATRPTVHPTWILIWLWVCSTVRSSLGRFGCMPLYKLLCCVELC